MRDVCIFLLVFVQAAWLATTLECKCRKNRWKRAAAFATLAVLALASVLTMFAAPSRYLDAFLGGSAAAHAVTVLVYTLSLRACGCAPSSLAGYAAAATCLLISGVALLSGAQPDGPPSSSPAPSPGWPGPAEAAPSPSPSPAGGVVLVVNREIEFRHLPAPRALARELGVASAAAAGSDGDARRALAEWYREPAPQIPAGFLAPIRGGAEEAARPPHHRFFACGA